ncbi:gas vesicle protein GvpO [Nocardiopsis ganjiahuensis]|uniref:gas vesicle protein GvpO n=1 Tax=Nocardiopsis ganjiahuensis TaxID=239984 RepID=UPI0003486F22|nr:gas vesicle protein [Nocardiopsis ganjiahuensis]
MGNEQRTEKPAPRRRSTERPSPAERLRKAQEQFEELTGIEVECVSGMEKSGEGWTLNLETLELRRIPDTVSLLATYALEVDEDGSLVSYRRTDRYTRGRANGS